MQGTSGPYQITIYSPPEKLTEDSMTHRKINHFNPELQKCKKLQKIYIYHLFIVSTLCKYPHFWQEYF